MIEIGQEKFREMDEFWPSRQDCQELETKNVTPQQSTIVEIVKGKKWDIKVVLKSSAESSRQGLSTVKRFGSGGSTSQVYEQPCPAVRADWCFAALSPTFQTTHCVTEDSPISRGNQYGYTECLSSTTETDSDEMKNRVVNRSVHWSETSKTVSNGESSCGYRKICPSSSIGTDVGTDTKEENGLESSYITESLLCQLETSKMICDEKSEDNYDHVERCPSSSIGTDVGQDTEEKSEQKCSYTESSVCQSETSHTKETVLAGDSLFGYIKSCPSAAGIDVDINEENEPEYQIYYSLSDSSEPKLETSLAEDKVSNLQCWCEYTHSCPSNTVGTDAATFKEGEQKYHAVGNYSGCLGSHSEASLTEGKVSGGGHWYCYTDSCLSSTCESEEKYPVECFNAAGIGSSGCQSETSFIQGTDCKEDGQCMGSGTYGNCKSERKHLVDYSYTATVQRSAGQSETSANQDMQYKGSSLHIDSENYQTNAIGIDAFANYGAGNEEEYQFDWYSTGNAASKSETIFSRHTAEVKSETKSSGGSEDRGSSHYIGTERCQTSARKIEVCHNKDGRKWEVEFCSPRNPVVKLETSDVRPFCEDCSKGFSTSDTLSKHRKIDGRERPCLCEVCGKGYIFDQHLEEHKRVHSGEEPYLCEICGERFSQEDELTTHVNAHNRKMCYDCNVCKAGYVLLDDLTAHMKIHSGERPYGCDVCASGFASLTDLNAHIMTHKGKRPYKCCICDKRFKKRWKLTMHLKKHNNKEDHNCTICGMGFMDRPALALHLKKHDGSGLYACTICGKKFKGTNKLKCLIVHNGKHRKERPYACNICGMRYNRREKLTNHMGWHTKEQFRCDDCGRRCSSEDSLSLHQRTHKGERPYICDTCGKGFLTESNCNTHRKIHSGEKSHLCEICGKGCTSSTDLKKHKVIHTREKPYICEVCGKSFSRQDGLKMHMRFHTGQKPHICPDCGKGFTISRGLVVHMKVHSGETPYWCDDCGAKFNGRVGLARHMTMHKGQET